jgi:hypothetical protein
MLANTLPLSVISPSSPADLASAGVGVRGEGDYTSDSDLVSVGYKMLTAAARVSCILHSADYETFGPLGGCRGVSRVYSH